MYICKECGLSFETYGVMYENHGECHGTPAIEQIAVCPQCGSTGFEEAEQCESCGEWMPKGKSLCEECGKNTMKRLYEVLQKTFEKEELTYISDHIDADEVYRLGVME